VEEYAYNVYIIKFYLKSHINSPKRFNLLTKDFDTARKLGTCLQIMLSIYEDDPLASFGFIGAAIIDEEKKENTANTQKYRVYSTIVKNLFSDRLFIHAYNKEKSAYTIINRNNPEPDLIDKVQKMFADYYPSLG